MLDGVGAEPVAAAGPALRPAEREHAGVLARAVVLNAESVRARTRARPPPPAPSRAGSARRRAALGEARCDAEAIAISSVVRSSRARTSGSAWNGFADERRNATRFESPASSTTAPSRTATAWTMCLASTTPPPRRTVTTIGSTAADYFSARTLPASYARPMPELPEVEAWVRELDPLVSATPVLQAGPPTLRR